MTTPPTPLTAWDTHGRPFLRALLRDTPRPDVLAGLAVIMHAAGVAYSLEDVAEEIGVRLPPSAPVQQRAARPVRARAKVRSAA